jgi:hypothetical protein
MKLTSNPNIISVTDWVKYKPYQSPNLTYDKHFAALATKVLGILNKQESWFKQYDLGRENRRELAIRLTSYYEDFISDIGIWRAFTRYNEELYGYPVPFYDLEDYATDYINYDDIAFILWHYVSTNNDDYIIAPDHVSIQILTDLLFDLFENDIEDAPATDFYDQFFTISDDFDFFEFKTRIKWFSLGSYLMGIDFSKSEAEQMEIAKKEMKKGTYRDIPPDMIAKMLYSFQDTYLFRKRSTYSALNAPEWLARVARCSDKKRAEIAEMCYWIDGSFWLDGQNEAQIHVKHVQTKQSFWIDKTSIQKSVPNLGKNTLLTMHCVKWNGVYQMSGAMQASEETDAKAIEKMERTPVKCAWMQSENSLTIARETTEKMYDAFVEFFGSPLVTFDNAHQMHQKEREYMAYYDKKLVESDEKVRENRKKLGNIEHEEVEFPDSWLNSKHDEAMFFNKNEGLMFFHEVREIIQYLTANTLSKKESMLLFSYIVKDYSPKLGRYLLETYGAKNLIFPIESTKMDVLTYLDFFWRLHSPEEFDKEYPLLTVMG